MPPSRLCATARIVPSFRHGVANGFKFYAIRPGSPLGILGLENGDLLLSINDLPLGTVDQALAAHRAMARSSHLDLELERRGQRHRIVVVVHDA